MFLNWRRNTVCAQQSWGLGIPQPPPGSVMISSSTEAIAVVHPSPARASAHAQDLGHPRAHVSSAVLSPVHHVSSHLPTLRCTNNAYPWTLSYSVTIESLDVSGCSMNRHLNFLVFLIPTDESMKKRNLHPSKQIVLISRDQVSSRQLKRLQIEIIKSPVLY